MMLVSGMFDGGGVCAEQAVQLDGGPGVRCCGTGSGDGLPVPSSWLEVMAAQPAAAATTAAATAPTEIGAATESPERGDGFYGLMVRLGVYVGIIPIGIGLPGDEEPRRGYRSDARAGEQGRADPNDQLLDLRLVLGCFRF